METCHLQKKTTTIYYPPKFYGFMRWYSVQFKKDMLGKSVMETLFFVFIVDMTHSRVTRHTEESHDMSPVCGNGGRNFFNIVRDQKKIRILDSKQQRNAAGYQDTQKLEIM